MTNQFSFNPKFQIILTNIPMVVPQGRTIKEVTIFGSLNAGIKWDVR